MGVVDSRYLDGHRCTVSDRLDHRRLLIAIAFHGYDDWVLECICRDLRRLPIMDCDVRRGKRFAAVANDPAVNCVRFSPAFLRRSGFINPARWRLSEN